MSQKYLEFRKGWWHYHRRVPARFSQFDDRKLIRVGLNTRDLTIAKFKRDQLVKADDDYWLSIASENPNLAEYQAAQFQAVKMGFEYLSSGELASDASLIELLKRVSAVNKGGLEVNVNAALGLLDAPKIKISEAYKIYLERLSVDETRLKSPNQMRNWRNSKDRAVNNFIGLVGDMDISAITREQANRYYQFWLDKITGEEKRSGSSGNRDLGNMRKLFTVWHAHIGEEDRVNPFRSLRFSTADTKKIKPYPVDYLKKILGVSAPLKNLNHEAKLIVLTMIETGCRPSEICNLKADQIRIDEPVPYLDIRPTKGREIKTRSSVRQVPLLGVSLAAMRLMPSGFTRYRDKEDSLAANTGKYFRNNGLFPDNSGLYRIYSIRHAFEDRMTEAGLDFELRCDLMGHRTSRPDYGEGGSMDFRARELSKIVLEFDPGVLV